MMRLHGSLIKVLTILVITTSIVLGAFTCAKKEAGEIRIGVIGPFTGDGATYGEAMKRGFELAFEKDENIRLIYEDSKLSAKDGVTAIQKLISADKVKIVLGAAASSVTIAMAPIADKNKVILFSSISTSDDLKTAGKYFFRNVPRNEYQGNTAAQFLFASLDKKNVAVLKKNDEYATNLSNSFIAEFEKLGGSVVLNEAYEPGTNDFKTVLSKIKKANADAIYSPGNYQEVGILLKQIVELGLNTILVGGDGSYSPELINIAGNAAEGSYYTLMAVRKNAYYHGFHNRFLTKYNKEPDVYDAYAYEAASIILIAVKEVGYDSDKISDYLVNQVFEESLTGSLNFDVDGEVDRNYGIIKVENGEFIDVDW